MSTPQTPPNDKPVPPVRIKLYGLISVTRRGYVIMLIVGAVLLCVMLGVWLTWISRTSSERIPQAEAMRPLLLVLNHLYLVVLALAVLLGLEAYFVLRRFAREEAARRLQQLDNEPLNSTS